jgi:hypothetical protein
MTNQEKEEEELWVQRYGPGVNEVSFRARPHHSLHSTLGVDIRATDQSTISFRPP